MSQTTATEQRGVPVIGIIGGIGSGKSRVAAELKRHGGYVVSGDELGHEALRQPDVRARIRAQWGDAVLGPDGEVNRKAVAKIVFADAQELRVLESFVFPHIEKRFREEIARAATLPNVRFVVLDAAVLLEAGWNGMCSAVVFVDADRSIRLKRLRETRGWTEEDLAARERSQMPPEVKKARASHVVPNAGTEAELEVAVQKLVESLPIPV